MRFLSTGIVEPLSRRAEITVELLGLNRHKLVNARRGLYKDQIQACLNSHVAGTNQDAKLKSFARPDAPFSTFARQCIQQVLPDVFSEAQAVSRKHVVASSVRTARKTAFLQSVHIENFRGVQKLQLEMPTTDQPRMDWLMLIGENAAGKSSILQAITLALLGDKDRMKLKLDARQFVRRGTSSGHVEITMRGDPKPRTLRWSSRSKEFRSSTPDSATVTMAYGATRLPPGLTRKTGTVAALNLFDPFEPLQDAKVWLNGLPRAEFDFSVRALKSLMALDQNKVSFRKSRGEILVKLHDSEVPLGQLSDGYQSVICLAADLMATIHHTFKGGMEAAEGVVILDELGAHLHPRWKMRIAKALRAAFPRIQFIVTTHDPLCLRGLRNGEICVIERTPRGRVFTRTELPPIEGMRVDQILQSEFFGLRSAMDPDVERDFDRMYALKSKNKLSASQKKELDALQRKLVEFEVLGSTRSERLMLSEINTFLAKERVAPAAANRDKLWKKTQQQIAAGLKKDLGIQL